MIMTYYSFLFYLTYVLTHTIMRSIIYSTYLPPIFFVLGERDSTRDTSVIGPRSQHNMIFNIMAQEYNIAQNNAETPNNYCQPELITRGGMREGSVVEDAVERNSWGKSRCEQMCRSPNTGGLHRTSGGAPLETPTLQDPELITRR